jgi:hypothetical protein
MPLVYLDVTSDCAAIRYLFSSACVDHDIQVDLARLDILCWPLTTYLDELHMYMGFPEA